MPNVLKINDINAVRVTEREKAIRVNCTLSGAYIQHTRGSSNPANGEVLDLTKIVGLNQPNQFFGQKGALVGYVVNPGGTGYSLSIVPGGDGLHWQLCVFSGVAAELAAGNYPAALTGDQDILLEFSARSFD